MAGALARRVGRRQAGVLAVVTGASAVLLGLTASGALASVGAPASRPASVIRPTALPTGTPPGPATAVGDQGVIYVFWKDPSGQLWEIQTTAWAKKWGTAHKLTGADQLGSAPTVAVLPDSSHGLSGPFVIWAQARTHQLYLTFLNHGQWESLPFTADAVATSAPAAVTVVAKCQHQGPGRDHAQPEGGAPTLRQPRALLAAAAAHAARQARIAARCRLRPERPGHVLEGPRPRPLVRLLPPALARALQAARRADRVAGRA